MYFAMKNGMVPVVYSDPSFTKIAIPGSYINVYAFAYVRELVDYLKYLDTNPVEYLQYFEWMKKFVMLSDDDSIRVNWCSICSKLHTTNVKTRV